jgi:hypothetical protein
MVLRSALRSEREVAGSLHRVILAQIAAPSGGITRGMF